MKPGAYLSAIVLLASSLSVDARADGWSGLEVGGYASLSTVPDEAAVRRLTKQQADSGDVRAMVAYAELLRTGWTQDYPLAMHRRAEAERYDRRAADAGDPLGQANAGVWCMTNSQIQTLPGACKSDVEAVHWFSLAMEQGDGRGTAFYGYMVEFGRGGLARDPVLAASYYREASKRGSSYGNEFLNDMVEFADRFPRGPKP
jgi:TPR repeat protein